MFNVGDQVRINKSSAAYGLFESLRDKTGVIIGVNNEDRAIYPYTVEIESLKYLFHEHELVLLSESFKEVEPPPFEYKDLAEETMEMLKDAPLPIWGEKTTKLKDFLDEMEKEQKPQALRYNKGKVELSLCPTNAIAAIATIFMVNSQKYGGKYPNNNWRLGAPQSQYIDCALRHLLKHAAGVELDDGEGGCGAPHLWLALTNLAMATEMQITKPELDDRYKAPLDYSIFTKYLPKD